MVLALQESLHAERRQLGNGAWIEVRSGWLTDADSLFDELMAVVPRRTPQMYDRVLDVPRLVSFHDLIDEPAPHPRLTQIRRRLNDTYGGELGEPFTTAGLCLYRDGNDSVAWHGDTIGRSSTEDTMVAIVSLGATRVSRYGRVAAARRYGCRRARGPAGDGWIVPAQLGTPDTEDVQADRSADQHPVPARGVRADSALHRGHRRGQQVTGALRVDRSDRLVGQHQGWR